MKRSFFSVASRRFDSSLLHFELKCQMIWQIFLNQLTETVSVRQFFLTLTGPIINNSICQDTIVGIMELQILDRFVDEL